MFLVPYGVWSTPALSKQTGLEGKKFPVCIDLKSQRKLVSFTVGPEVTFLVS